MSEGPILRLIGSSCITQVLVVNAQSILLVPYVAGRHSQSVQQYLLMHKSTLIFLLTTSWATLDFVRQSVAQTDDFEAFEPVGFPPAGPVTVGESFPVHFRSAKTPTCRGTMLPLVAVFVRPINYLSPPIAFDKAGIVADSTMVGCQAGVYSASVRFTIAAMYRQQVYLYVELPEVEAEQPRALVGSPFDLDVLPTAVEWSATAIICGRVRGHPWPEACSEGVGFDLAMAGLPMQLMLQTNDKYYNAIVGCSASTPPRSLVQVSQMTEIVKYACR